jgi:hypothetical protein
VIETDTQNAELVELKKQVKLLTIVTSGLFVVVPGLIIGAARRGPASNSGWPDISAGVLQAKRIVLMTDDGKPAAMLNTAGGSAALVLLDTKGEIRVLVGVGNNKGHITLSGENQDGATSITNGALLIGSEKSGGVEVEGPPVGGPVVRVFDQSGYSAAVGRSTVINHTDGTVSVTSAAASLMGSSKERASTWSLLSQPILASTTATDSKNDARKPPSARSR